MLKPCPMCGPGKSMVERFKNGYGKWQIGCGACGLTSGFRIDNDIEKLEQHWNSRPMESDNLSFQPTQEQRG